MINLEEYTNYCTFPFVSVSLDQYASVRQCCSCAFDIPKPYYFDVDNIDDILNNEYMQDVRSAFLENKRHPTCVRCWNADDIGARSFRKTAIDPTNPNGHIHHSESTFKKELDYTDIRYIDLNLGNKCNLACRMCDATSSTLLAKNLKDIGRWTGEIDHNPSRKLKDSILEFIDRCKNLTGIYAVGGEPLVNDFFDEILDLLIKNGSAKNIDLQFNTNLYTNKIGAYIDRFGKFKSNRISVSVDGESDTYNYIRWPGNFNKLVKNWKEIEKIVEHNKVHVGISTTMQNLNAHNYYDLIHSELGNIGGKKTCFYFIDIMGTNQLNLVPKYILAEQITKLKSMKFIHQHVHSLIKTLENAHDQPIDIVRVQKFFSITKDFDESRKQNLFHTMPWFLRLADEYNIPAW